MKKILVLLSLVVLSFTCNAQYGLFKIGEKPTDTTFFQIGGMNMVIGEFEEYYIHGFQFYTVRMDGYIPKYNIIKKAIFDTLANWQSHHIYTIRTLTQTRVDLIEKTDTVNFRGTWLYMTAPALRDSVISDMRYYLGL